MQPAEKDYYKDLYNGVKVVVVGDACVGKSSFLTRHINQSFNTDYVATIRESYETSVVIDGNTVKVQVEDTAGHADYESVRPVSYKGANAFLVLFAVVSPSSFSTATNSWIDEVEHNVPGAPFVLVGTKNDLRNDPETLRKLKGQSPITKEKADAVAKEAGAIGYVETSALKEEGLAEPFDLIVKAIVDERRREADELKELEAAQTTPKKQGKSASGQSKGSGGGFFSKKKK